MKTFRNRILPLLSCIIFGTVLSWVSIYVFWFAVLTFHSLPAARFCSAVGDFLLAPANWVFEMIGGDQTTILFEPNMFSATNGLILGILFYCVYRAVVRQREEGKRVDEEPAKPRRMEAKVG